MNLKFIKSSEKRQILKELNEQFGISELPYLLFWTGSEKIRAFSGSLSKDEIMTLKSIVPVELIGSYLLKKESDWRLSLDATILLKNQISKNIIEISDEQSEAWIRGFDLNIKYEDKCSIIIKHGNDFIGCGKSNGEKIFNYVPKERRIRKIEKLY